MSVNKVILVGRIGKDPDVRYIDNGVAVAKFPLATDEHYTNKNGERITQTEWHNIVAWRGLAEIVENFMKKGQLLYIEGQLRSRSYDDKEGSKRYITEILANNIQMLDKREGPKTSTSSTNINSNQVDSPNKEGINIDNEEEDLPF